MRKIKNKISHILAARRGIYVWGAGSSGQSALRKWLPSDKIVAIVDSNPLLAGESILGHRIITPNQIDPEKGDIIVVCSDAYQEILEQIHKSDFPGDAVYIFELFPACDSGNESEIDKLYIDFARQVDRDIFRYLLFRPQFLVNVTYRLTRYFFGFRLLRPLYYICLFMHVLNCILFSISLPVTVSAGAGLFFPHFGSIVFHPFSRLGCFCTIYHSTTLGSNDDGGVPILNDFITVYTGALVLGACRLGDHTRVGARSMLSDLEDEGYCTIAGHPPRIVRKFQRRNGPFRTAKSSVK